MIDLLIMRVNILTGKKVLIPAVSSVVASVITSAFTTIIMFFIMRYRLIAWQQYFTREFQLTCFLIHVKKFYFQGVSNLDIAFFNGFKTLPFNLRDVKQAFLPGMISTNTPKGTHF